MQIATVTNGTLHTKTRMAYWIPMPAVPIWTANGGDYPKDNGTIYDPFHSTINNGVPPPNPPGVNANTAFWSISWQGYGLGGRTIPKPDTLNSIYFNTQETLSDHVVDKTVKWGVIGHPELNNVAVFKATVTMPATPNTLDFVLAAYADQQRFHTDVGAHTYRYNPNTHVQTDVTNQMLPGYPGVPDAFIVAGNGNRYAMGLWSRTPNVNQWVYNTSTDLHLYCLLRPAPIPSTSLSMTQYLASGTLNDVKVAFDSIATINPAP